MERHYPTSFYPFPSLPPGEGRSWPLASQARSGGVGRCRAGRHGSCGRHLGTGRLAIASPSHDKSGGWNHIEDRRSRPRASRSRTGEGALGRRERAWGCTGEGTQGRSTAPAAVRPRAPTLMVDMRAAEAGRVAKSGWGRRPQGRERGEKEAVMPDEGGGGRVKFMGVRGRGGFDI
jgi:hypothetical protein